jgi:predicted transcriptional regulator
MSKYISYYRWPHGYRVAKVKDMCAFSPLGEPPHGNGWGVALFVVYGRTFREAEEKAARRIEDEKRIAKTAQEMLLLEEKSRGGRPYEGKTIQARIKNELRNQQKRTASAIADALGVSDVLVQNHLNKLLESGHVSRIKTTNKAGYTYYFYRLRKPYKKNRIDLSGALKRKLIIDAVKDLLKCGLVASRKNIEIRTKFSKTVVSIYLREFCKKGVLVRHNLTALAYHYTIGDFEKWY